MIFCNKLNTLPYGDDKREQQASKRANGVSILFFLFLLEALYVSVTELTENSGTTFFRQTLSFHSVILRKQRILKVFNIFKQCVANIKMIFFSEIVTSEKNYVKRIFLCHHRDTCFFGGSVSNISSYLYKNMFQLYIRVCVVGYHVKEHADTKNQ